MQVWVLGSRSFFSKFSAEVTLRSGLNSRLFRIPDRVDKKLEYLIILVEYWVDSFRPENCLLVKFDVVCCEDVKIQEIENVIHWILQKKTNRILDTETQKQEKHDSDKKYI